MIITIAHQNNLVNHHTSEKIIQLILLLQDFQTTDSHKNIIIYKEGSVPKTTIDIVSPVFKNTITDKDTTNYQDKSTKEETMIKSISIKISRRKLGEFIEQDLITIWTKIQ